MAIITMILGESGTGKSYSLRNLDPATTAIINVQRKPFPFRQKFDRVFPIDDYARIINGMQKSDAKRFIIDDSQYLMANEFMRRAKEKGYEKFTEIGYNYWNLVNVAASLPDDRTAYFLQHTDVSESGREKAKTIGKMLDDKINIEGMFTVVLKTVVMDGKFYFATVNSGNDTVKSPCEMFDAPLIENDLAEVDKKIREFYGMEV